MKGKKRLLLLGTLIMSLALTGCRVGSGNNNGEWNSDERDAAARQSVNELVGAIEDYDVATIEGLLAPEFVLEIEDKGLYNPQPKSRAILLNELTDNGEDLYQLGIRTLKGYEMVLDLDAIGQYGVNNGQESKPFGPYDGDGVRISGNDITITNKITVSGIVNAECCFEVYEKAPTMGINDFVCTDKGSIKFELIYLGAEYKIKSMKITFNGTGEGNQIYVPRSMTVSTTTGSSGFGFGIYRP